MPKVMIRKKVQPLLWPGRSEFVFYMIVLEDLYTQIVFVFALVGYPDLQLKQ